MTSDSREIVVSRLITAPRSLVFAAWTEPAHVAKWFGPRAFTLGVRTMDVRPGGAYHIAWLDANGADHPFRGVYLEVSPPERLVYTDVWGENLPADQAVVTVTFEEQEGKTLLTVRTRFGTAEVLEWAEKQGFLVGWGEILDRLEEALSA